MTEITWFDFSPDAGPQCLCSWCGKTVVVDDPIRVVNNLMGLEARFHPVCYAEVGFVFKDGHPQRGAAPYRLNRALGTGVPHSWEKTIYGMAVREWLDRERIGTPIHASAIPKVIDYLNYYIFGPCWSGPAVTNLRLTAHTMQGIGDIESFLEQLSSIGINPFVKEEA